MNFKKSDKFMKKRFDEQLSNGYGKPIVVYKNWNQPNMQTFELLGRKHKDGRFTFSTDSRNKLAESDVLQVKEQLDLWRINYIEEMTVKCHVETVKISDDGRNIMSKAMNQNRSVHIEKGNYNENIKGDYYEQSGNFGIGHMSGGEIKDGAKVGGVINEAEKQNLADAAQEIQQLLEQLSETYPTTTSREKNIVVGEAVDRIEGNPPLKAKVINALKAGGTEAFKEAIEHPLVNILVATIEGWRDTK